MALAEAGPASGRYNGDVMSAWSAKTQDSLTTQRRYDRQAALFDLMEAPLEALLFGGLRRRLWSGVRETRVLEIGVGTGKNMPYHPEGTITHTVRGAVSLPTSSESELTSETDGS